MMSLRNAEVTVPTTTSVFSEAPEDWDDFVAATPGGTFCHLGVWRGIMEGVLGHECVYVQSRDASGTLQGVLPLVWVRSRLFGRYLVSVPFLNYGGPLGAPEVRIELARRALEEAKQGGADRLEFRWRAAARGGSGRGMTEAEDTLPEGFVESQRKVTVLLPLPNDPEELWKDGLKAKVRSQVRRPMKEGLETRIGPEEITAFYDVFARNMRDLGTPVLPRALFEHLPELFGDRVVFAAVYQGSRPVAAGCGFHFGGEFELTWASSLREFNRIAPNMLLYWRLMEGAIERGAGTFNFGRCTPGGGTHRFKLQWGGTDEPLPWAGWSAGAADATPNPDQGKYQLATRIWSRLPVGLTNRLGPPLARRIP